MRSGAADPYSESEHDRSTEGHDRQRGTQGDVKEPVSHPRNGQQFDRDHDPGYGERPVHVADDERQRVKDPTERGMERGRPPAGYYTRKTAEEAL